MVHSVEQKSSADAQLVYGRLNSNYRRPHIRRITGYHAHAATFCWFSRISNILWNAHRQSTAESFLSIQSARVSTIVNIIFATQLQIKKTTVNLRQNFYEWCDADQVASSGLQSSKSLHWQSASTRSEAMITTHAIVSDGH